MMWGCCQDLPVKQTEVFQHLKKIVMFPTSTGRFTLQLRVFCGCFMEKKKKIGHTYKKVVVFVREVSTDPSRMNHAKIR